MNRAAINQKLSKIPNQVIIVVILILWLIPTIGLFVTSFRPLQDINTSGWDFTIEDCEDNCAKIRFGLGAIKNVGQSPVETIIAARKEGGRFKDLASGRRNSRLFNDQVANNLLQLLVECLDSVTFRRDLFNTRLYGKQNFLFGLAGRLGNIRDDFLRRSCVTDFSVVRHIACGLDFLVV